MHMLDPDCLLPTALYLRERLGLGGERPKQLRGQRAMGLHLLRRSAPRIGRFGEALLAPEQRDFSRGDRAANANGIDRKMAAEREAHG